MLLVHSFLLLSASIGLGSTLCPNGYSTMDNRMCYTVHNAPTARDSAAQRCNHDGGSLAAIPNSFVNSYIYSLANQAQANFLWIGVKCYGGDVNNCMNDDGTPFGTYSNFYPNNPNPLSDCVYMSAKSPSSQLWFSFDCSEPFAFACEIPYNNSVATTSTTLGTTTKGVTGCPIGYTSFQGTCYKYNLDSRTRVEAASACATVPGGYLASIGSYEVNQFLISLENLSTPKNGYVHIGLQCPDVMYNKDTRSCVWDDGTPFSFNGFSGVNPLEDGTCIDFDSGKWDNTMDCAQEANYFCEANMSA